MRTPALVPSTDLMTPPQLAQEWQISEKTLANWRSAKVGPPYEKLGGAVRYSRAAVSRWRAEQQSDLEDPRGAA